MGWASASSIFNKVAKALVDANASDDLTRAVLAPLITVLRDGDWDTCDESREEFADDPVIAELFARELGTELWASNIHGAIDFSDADGWTLSCSQCGFIDGAEGTAEGHDRLVRRWADHDQAEHDGDGVVNGRMLILAGGGR